VFIIRLHIILWLESGHQNRTGTLPPIVVDGLVQHWMSADPGQCPASDFPPELEQDEVEIHVPATPALFLHETGSLFVQHWISADPGQCPASDVPPELEQDEVEIHVPETPALFLQTVGVASLAVLVVVAPVVAAFVAPPGVQHWISSGPGQKPGSDLSPFAAHDEVDIQVPEIPALFLQDEGVFGVPEVPVGLGLLLVFAVGFAVGFSLAFVVVVGFADGFLAPSVSFGPTPIHILGKGS
jgi:hypothetical protein